MNWNLEQRVAQIEKGTADLREGIDTIAKYGESILAIEQSHREDNILIFALHELVKEQTDSIKFLEKCLLELRLEVFSIREKLEKPRASKSTLKGKEKEGYFQESQ